MKKSIFSLALLVVINHAFANEPGKESNSNQKNEPVQVSASLAEENENPNAEGLKPDAGAITFEVNFQPFSNSGGLLSLSYFRCRYFLNEDLAVRAGLLTSFGSESPNVSTRLSNFDFELRPGVEKHFGGRDRLSPYIGAELIFSNYSRARQIEDGDRLTGAWSSEGSNRGFYNLGLGALVGTDFYFSRHIYVGFEAGFNLLFKKHHNIAVDGVVISEGSSTFNLGPNMNSALRLGFVF
jgi:hypothetical protein